MLRACVWHDVTSWCEEIRTKNLRRFMVLHLLLLAQVEEKLLSTSGQQSPSKDSITKWTLLSFTVAAVKVHHRTCLYIHLHTCFWSATAIRNAFGIYRAMGVGWKKNPTFGWGNQNPKPNELQPPGFFLLNSPGCSAKDRRCKSSTGL